MENPSSKRRMVKLKKMKVGIRLVWEGLAAERGCCIGVTRCRKEATPYFLHTHTESDCAF